MTYDKKARVLSDEFMNVDSSTNDECNRRQNKKSFLYADVESISSNSLIENVEFMKEDFHEKKDIVLLKREMSFKNYFEKKGSNDDETRQKADPFNAKLELHKSLNLKLLYENHHRVFSTS